MELSESNTDIAIIGLSCTFPGAGNSDEFWENLRNGVESISFFSEEELMMSGVPHSILKQNNYVKSRGILTGIDLFDAEFFGMTRGEPEITDPQHKVFLECAWEAMENAGYAAGKNQYSIGVYAGQGINTYLMNNLYSRQEILTSIKNYRFMIGNDKDFLSTYVSYKLNLKGPSITIQTACSTSLVTVHLACQSLLNFECDMALAGGVSIPIPQKEGYLYQQGMIFSPNGHCQVFDARSQGTVPSSGAGVVVLKRLRNAVADNDNILCIIKGSAINNDGSSKIGYTAPGLEGQISVIKEALTLSEVDPRSITYVEAHGTGTQLGDPIEISALTEAFGSSEKKFCAIGSVKSNIGHADAASGIAGLIKAVLSLKHKQIPPSLHFKSANPEIDFANSPFYVNTTLSDWKINDYPRRAGVSSFGIGGTNAHVILEEYNKPNDKMRQEKTNESYIIVLSAKNEDRLHIYASNLLNFIQDNKDTLCIADIAYTLQTGRVPMNERLAVVVSGIDDLSEKLKRYTLHDMNIEDFYSGRISNVPDKNSAAESEGQKKTMTDNKQALSKLCESWVTGMKIDWGTLYSKHIPNKIPLPAYPFDKKKYWASLPKENGTKKDKLHPLVHTNVSTMEEQKFFTLLTNTEFAISEHLVLGKPVLVGMSHVEIARAASELSGVKAINKIKNIVWHQPIIMENDRPLEINTRLYPEANSVKFEICGYSNGANKIIYSQGKLMVENGPVAGNLDIENIKARCSHNHVGEEEFYKNCELVGIQYGPSFRFVKNLYASDTEVVGELRMPAHLKDSSGDFVLHPGLMDSVLQTLGGFRKNDSKTFLPFSLGEIEIIGKLPETSYVYATKVNTSDENLKICDATVTDTNGKILVKIHNFCLRLVAPLNEKKEPAIVYLKSVWKQSDKKVDNTAESSGHTLILFDIDENVYQKLNSDSSFRQNIILVKPGQEFQVIGSHVYEVNPALTENYDKLMKNLQKQGVIPGKILFLWPKNDNENTYVNSKDIVKQSLSYAVKALLFLAQSLLKFYFKSNIYVLYVYENENPFQAAVGGFSRTISQENSNYFFKTVRLPDIDDARGVVTISQKEFFIKDGTAEVSYKGKLRWVKEFEEYDIESDAGVNLPLKENGVYIITGGTGGLGCVFSKYLAKKYKAKLVIVSRSDINSQKENLIKEIQSLGSEVLHIKADVANLEDVKHVVSETKNKFKQINGIIHAAGVLCDNFIINQNEKDFETVLGPKVNGTLYIDESTKNEPLDFFLCFSSIAGLIGNAGQSSYAYANSFMDNFVNMRESLKKNGKRSGKTISINWPLWKDGGMRVDKETNKLFSNIFGFKSLPANLGLEIFEKSLSCKENHVIAFYGDSQKIVKNLKRIKILEAGNFDSSHSNILKNNDMQSRKINEELVKLVSRELTDILLDSMKIEQADLDADMSQYNLSSIAVVELVNKINKVYGLEEMPAVFFEHKTLASFIKYLCEKYEDKLSVFYNQQVKLSNLDEEPVRIMDPGGLSRMPSRFITEIEKGIETEQDNSIAIIGMSGMMPDSENLDEFWQHLLQGDNLISEIPKDRWDWEKWYGDPFNNVNKTNIKWGGFMKEVDKFDASFFHISPKEAELMDPQQRLFLMTVWHCIEDAGYKISDISGTSMGLFVGVAGAEYDDSLRESNINIEAYSSTGLALSILPNRISYLLDFHGHSEPINTACSSSLVAIHRAVTAILNGECETAIAGGVNALLSPKVYVSFNKAGMLTLDGKCKVFDKNANGYVRGEGVGAIFLKPLHKAQKDGDHIYGVIKGTAINHGGKVNTLTSPNPIMQAKAVFEAWSKANVDTRTVSYIEAHGTGTALGDPIEINGLKRAFKKLYEEQNLSVSNPHCGVGSVKSNIGHLESAAGIASVLKVLLAMKHKIIPGTINFKDINPQIQLQNSPFYIVDKNKEWERVQDLEGHHVPRRAGISSFGFGGVNAHIIIEDYENNRHGLREETEEQQIIILSAKNEQRLKEYAKNMCQYIAKNKSELLLQDIAFTLQAGRDAMEERLGIMARDKKDLTEKLERYVQGEKRNDIFSGNVKQKTKLAAKNGDIKTIIETSLADGKTEKLIDLWVNGMEIDWEILLPIKDVRRISLPVYPFEKRRYWFDSYNNKKNNVKESFMENNEINKTQTSETKRIEDKETDEDKITLKNSSGYINKNEINPTDQIVDKKLEHSVKEEIINSLSAFLHLPASEISDDAPLKDYGLDSVGSVELIGSLNKKFNTKINATVLYDYHTVGKLSKHFASVIFNMQGSNQEQGGVSVPRVSVSDEPENRILDNSMINADDRKNEDSNYLYNKNGETNNNDVAIIGIAGRFPGANDVDAFWENISHGVSSIKEIPDERWNNITPQIAKNIYCKKGGFIDDIDKFDALYFRISPAEAELMDPQHRIFLETSIKALEDAGYTEKFLNNTKCGVSIGVSSNEYRALVLQNDNQDTFAYSVLGVLNSLLPSRVSYFLNLKGPTIAIDTACSSALVAVDNAYQALICGRADMMLAGGVALSVTEERFVITSSLEVLSRKGKCSTFDNDADGYVPGEGAGVIVMKRLSDAIRDKDHIYGVIKGSLTNQDGSTNGITAPSAESQKSLELEVYKNSGINPETITYVEAHGTGTKLGDPIEVLALTESFREYTNKKQYCAIGSVKTNVGHGAAAGGMFSLIKVLLSIKNKKIPPSLNYNVKNEHIDFENSPFFVNTELRNWKADENFVRRAAISSFGLSGTNCHMVIEEFPVAQANESTLLPCYIIPFSAKTEAVLKQKMDDFAIWLNKEQKHSMEDISFTLLAGRNHFLIRSVFIARDIEELKKKMQEIQDNGGSNNFFMENLIKTPVKQKTLMKELGRHLLSVLRNESLSSAEYTEKIKALAELYLKGYDLDWKLLFKNSAGLISLPTYPFDKKRHWVEKTHSAVVANNSSQENLKNMHDFIPFVNYDEFNKRFTVKFKGDEFYLRGHIIAGNKVVPAVLYSEIIRAASEKILGNKKVAILKNFIFAAPIVVGEKGKTITIDFHDAPNGYNVKMYSINTNNQKIPILQVDIIYGKLEQQNNKPEYFDVKKIMNRAKKSVAGDVLYEGYKRIHLHYAPFFQSLQKLCFNKKKSLGVLKLSDEIRNTLDAFIFHPVFMDGSLQTLAGLVTQNIADVESKFYTPYMLQEIELLGRFSKTCYSYATPAGKAYDKDSEIVQYNIIVINDSGQIVLRMKNLMLKNAQMELFQEDSQIIGNLLNKKNLV